MTLSPAEGQDLSEFGIVQLESTPGPPEALIFHAAAAGHNQELIVPRK